MLHDPSNDTTFEIEIIACPECAAPAEVSWRARVAADCDLAYVRCLLRHWFLMPVGRPTG